MGNNIGFDDLGYHDSAVVAFEQRADLIHLELEDAERKNSELLAVSMNFASVHSVRIDGVPCTSITMEAEHAEVRHLTRDKGTFAFLIEWKNFGEHTAWMRGYRFVSPSVVDEVTSLPLQDIDFCGAELVSIKKGSGSVHFRIDHALVDGRGRLVSVDFHHILSLKIDSQPSSLGEADEVIGKISKIAAENAGTILTIQSANDLANKPTNREYRIECDWCQVQLI